jgi:hypothetical protein
MRPNRTKNSSGPVRFRFFLVPGTGLQNSKNTIEILMEEGPTSLKNDLQDWKIEEIDGRKTISFKGKNYIPKNLEL